MTRKGKQKRISYPSLLVGTMVIIGFAAFILGSGVGKVCAVTVNGKTIAYAQSKGQAQEALAKLAARKTKELAQDVMVDGKVEFKTVSKSENAYDDKKLADALNSKLNFITEGIVVKINGTPQFRFKNRDITDRFIKQLRNKYSTGENCKISFDEKVETLNRKVNIKKLNTVEEAMRLAGQGRGQPEIHIIEEKDTLWDLAVANNTTVDRLKSLNPGVDENLRPGDELKVSGSAPLLTVIASYETIEQEKIPFGTQYRSDASLPMGTRKIIQQGTEGLKKVTYKVTAKNGKITEKTVLNENTIENSEPRIIKQGTKLTYSSRGGRLAWPVSGSITSRFGPRWGGKHRGIDIAAGYGIPIRAAAPGQVVSADWQGGYGRMVVISHGNGIVTRYAHMSAFGVQKGQTVNKGQIIGKVGTSGNTTGPHVHLEVLKNGAQTNPLNYL